ncbi:MAG: class I SAM-dependent methyltransferase [Lachnospiraceae bacterium]|nr:class I SAM-dependent methyltransferase [Lachnospiraceae bacterium]
MAAGEPVNSKEPVTAVEPVTSKEPVTAVEPVYRPTEDVPEEKAEKTAGRQSGAAAPAGWLVNDAGTRLQYLCADIFDLLPALHRQGDRYDVVILDPPAFTKSRNSIKAAVRGYREINQRGLRLVRDGGFLATCSCSHFMDPDLFRDTIAKAAKDAHKRLRQIEFRTQAPDHPILWASEESYYLKFYIFQVVEEK